MSVPKQPATVIVIRRRIEQACQRLGMSGQGLTTDLSSWVGMSTHLQQKWQGLRLSESVVPSSLAEDFPRSHPWPQLYTIRFGDRVPQIPEEDVGVLRREPVKYGIVFDDASTLTWGLVLWDHGGTLRLVEQSIQYQVPNYKLRKSGQRRPDWICRYDYSPIDFGKTERDYVGQAVHHVHIGPRDDQRVHFPLHPLNGFTMLHWLLRAFPKASPGGTAERLEDEEGRFRRLLIPEAELLCLNAPFPTQTP